jgi:hypothetical protein
MPRYNCEPREISNRNGVRFVAYKQEGVWFAHFPGGRDPVQSSDTLDGLKLRLQQYTLLDAQRLSPGVTTAANSSNRRSEHNSAFSAVQVREWVRAALASAGFGEDPPTLYLNEASNIHLNMGKDAAIAYIAEKKSLFLPPSR